MVNKSSVIRGLILFKENQETTLFFRVKEQAEISAYFFALFLILKEVMEMGKEHIYTKQLRADEELLGTEISGVYHCSDMKLVSRGTGKSYYLMTLTDSTGSIPAKVNSGLVNPAMKGCAVSVTAMVSVYSGNAALELFTIAQYREPSMEAETDTKPLSEETQRILVCSVEREFAVEQMHRLRGFINTLPEAYGVCALKIITKPTVNTMATVPAGVSAYCYNGGLLDKTVYLVSLADKLLSEMPADNAYPVTAANRDVILLALLSSCAACSEVYSPLPDCKENILIGNSVLLSRIIQKIHESEGIEQGNVIHCIRVVCENQKPLTQEAELVQMIWNLGTVTAAYSYAEYANLTHVNGHAIRKEGD